MNTIAKENTPFYSYIREIAAKGTQELIDANLYSSVNEGPDVERIVKAISPYLEAKKHTQLSDNRLGWIIDHQAVQVGTAFHGLGNADIATLWYQIGQFGWRGQAHWYEGNLLDLDWYDREGPAIGQENAAICAALAGNNPRAEQLFEWISHNRTKTDTEIQMCERERNYQVIWEGLGFQIFALIWLGDQWHEVSRLAEIGRNAIEKTRKAGHPKDFREPQLLIEIGGKLSSFFLNPGEQAREIAMNSLRLDKMPDRENHLRANMLGYIFSIGRRYPQINPYSADVFNLRLWHPSASNRQTAPTYGEIQNAVNEIFRQAEGQKKIAVRVSSVDLHLRVGGYPNANHQLQLCCQVMRDNLKGGGKITGQSSSSDEGWLEIYYSLPRKG